MASPASQGRRRSQAKPNTEDHALNMIASEAEARLAAKRAARAEARSIRMKELERMQHEADEKMDREYQRSLLSDDAVKQRSVRVADKIQARIAAVNDSEMNGPVSQELQIKTLQDSLREMSERFKQAMVSNAQLDNEKQALSYQVDCLKDRLEDSEERIENLKQEILDKTRDFNRISRENKNHIEELTKMREQLILRDKLLEEHGIPTDGSEQPDMSQSELSTSRINESLNLDLTDLDQSGLNKSRESSRRSSLPDDRESLLEQIKILKEKVSDLRRDPEMDDARLRDAENLQTSGDQNERVAALADQDLERSETFEDITDEAIEMRDRGRVGMIINNNERNEDYDVIEQNLQQGEVRCFEDRSYENSYMTESVTDSMMESFASTVVTTESIESERPLEISMTAALEEANASGTADNHTKEDRIASNTQKQSEKDLNDYDIVESTNYAGSEQVNVSAEAIEENHAKEEDLLSPLRKASVDTLESEREKSSDLEDIDNAQRDNEEHENYKLLPNDIVNVCSDETFDSILPKENQPLDHLKVADEEDAASDIVDVEMPALEPADDENKPEDQEDNNDLFEKSIPDAQLQEEESIADLVEDLPQGSAMDLESESAQHVGEDIPINLEHESKELNVVNNAEYDSSGLAQPSVTQNESVTESSKETTDNLNMLLEAESISDSNQTAKSIANTPDDDIQIQCTEQKDELPSLEIQEDSLEGSNVLNAETDVDHKDDEEAFLNIEPEEAFFDARSEMTVDSDTLRISNEQNIEKHNDSHENFEDVGIKDIDVVNHKTAEEHNEMFNKKQPVFIEEESSFSNQDDAEKVVSSNQDDAEKVVSSDSHSDSTHEASGDIADESAINVEQTDLIAVIDSDIQNSTPSQPKESLNTESSHDLAAEENCIGDDMVHIKNVTEEPRVQGNIEVDLAVQTDHSQQNNQPSDGDIGSRSVDHAVTSPDKYLDAKDPETFENVEMTDVIFEADVEIFEKDKAEITSDLPGGLNQDEEHNVPCDNELGIEDKELTVEEPSRDDTTAESRGIVASEACDDSIKDATAPSPNISVILSEEERPVQNQQAVDVVETPAAKDKLLEAYDTRQKLIASSPESLRRGASPQPVPKQRKKNKKKKKKGKDVVKVVEQLAATEFPPLDYLQQENKPVSQQEDKLDQPVAQQEDGADKPVSLQEDKLDQPVSQQEDEADKAVSRQEDKPDESVSQQEDKPDRPASQQEDKPDRPVSVEVTYPVEENAKSDEAQVNLVQENPQDTSLDTSNEQGDTTKYVSTVDREDSASDISQNRRSSTGSASGFSDNEMGEKSNKKDKKKSKKDSKKDGCKNQ